MNNYPAFWHDLQDKIFALNNYIEQSGMISLLLMSSAIATLILALRALRFIQQQDNDEKQSEMIYKLLQVIVRLKDRYRLLRSPLIHTSEYPPKYQNRNPVTLQAQDEAQIYRYVFLKRWQLFNSEWEALHNQVLLSELFWKPWCRNEILELQNMINELKYNIEQLIIFKRYELLRSPSVDPIRLEELNQLVFLQGEKDQSQVRFDKDVNIMLNYLKKK